MHIPMHLCGPVWSRGDPLAHSWLDMVVGNCRIEKKIGEGGCGQVFLGRDQLLERPVALKVLHPRLAERSDTSERFISEAQALARLAHPNIATLYTFHQVHDTYVMVMEYVEGLTFEALLKRDGPMDPRTAIPLLAQALDGIGHVHRQGIIHRDLKATNLMLNGDGVVKVMDFGIAQIADRQFDDGSERGSERPVGTPEYMSPEQVRGEELDPRSDLYSLGVLFYKLLSGRLPIRGDTPSDVMRAQLETSPRPIRELVPALPETVVEGVEKAMAREPAARFADASAFRDTLLRASETIAGLENLVVPDPTTLHALSPEVAAERDDTATFDATPRPPDTELAPTRVLWDDEEVAPAPIARGARLWRNSAALGFAIFFGLSLYWIRPERVVAVPKTEPLERRSLTGLPPLPPPGFATWPPPQRTGELARVPGLRLGPADFIAAVEASAVPVDGVATDAEKAQAEADAKPQTKRATRTTARRAGKTPRKRKAVDVASRDDAETDLNALRDETPSGTKQQEGWIIRR